METQVQLYTFGRLHREVERRLNRRIDYYQLAYLIKTRQIKPQQMFGNRRQFAPEAIEQVLAAIRAGRRRGSGLWPRQKKARPTAEVVPED